MFRLFLVAALLCSSSLFSRDKLKDQEARALVQQSIDMMALGKLSDPAFRIKVNIRLKELRGGDIEGTYIQQRSGDLIRTETSIGSYRETYIQDQEKAWRARNTDRPLRIMEALMPLEPRRPLKEDMQLTVSDKDIHGEKVQCVYGRLKGGFSQTWCLDPITKQLRWYIEQDFWVLEFQDYRAFKEKQYPRIMRTYEAERLVAEARVSEIAAVVLQQNELTVEKGMEPVPIMECEVHDSEDFIQRKVMPEYPMISRQARVQGSVLFFTVIQKDGTVGRLVTLGSPDLNLEKSARAAVERWRYRPIVACGQVAEVETTIRISFTLSGS